MIRKVVLGLFVVMGVAFIALFAVASTRPDTFHVERSAVLAAPPATVHAVLDDLHRFHEWSPWQELDPAMTVRYEGPPTGVGSSLAWAGNREAGEGRMTITESTTPSSVTQRLEFIKPFPSASDVRFALEPEGEGTKVTWAMDGKADFLTKLMCLFVSMDAVMGKDFEKGLANLGRVTGSAPAPADSTATP